MHKPYVHILFVCIYDLKRDKFILVTLDAFKRQKYLHFFANFALEQNILIIKQYQSHTPAPTPTPT